MELLVLLTLLGMLDRRKPSSLPEQAKEAEKDAEKKRDEAAKTNHPADQQKAEEAARKAETLNTAARTPPPWPQVIPAGLPPFPSGWTPDEPVGPGVAARAAQLLPILWAHGPGTWKTEQTAGRWITYRATPMGTKRGVVAYKPRPGAPAAQPQPHFGPSPAEPFPPLNRPFVEPPIARPGQQNIDPPRAQPASSSALALPTLRQGSSGPEVQLVQTKLGVTPADGKFGPVTKAAVTHYQLRRGLTPDGIVGPKTWAALMGGGAA